MINDYFFQQKQINWHMNEHETEISKLVKKTRNREISPRDAAEQIEHRLHLMAEMARIKEEQ